MVEDELKNLPPEERIKRLKELEKKKKQEIEEAQKRIKESEVELTARDEWIRRVPIPQVAKENLKDLTREEKEVVKAHRGLKEEKKEESVEATVRKKEVEEGSPLEALAEERVDLPPELLNSEYARHLGQKPMQELYKEMKSLASNIEDKGYMNRDEQRKVEYLLAGMEHKLEDAEEGTYSFTERTAKKANLTREIGEKLRGMYQGNRTEYHT
ncbi:MAG TPA: hypothetical protein VJA23_03515 [Candidatus Nanoarchaeia archaeon]|nr:hypothetical protein [Candidatus Nanoarchaeia archaeon]